MNSGAFKKEIRKHALAFAKRRDITVDEAHKDAIIFCSLDDCFHPKSLENIRREGVPSVVESCR